MHWKATTSTALIVQIVITPNKTVLEWREAGTGERLYTWMQTEFFARPKVIMYIRVLAYKAYRSNVRTLAFAVWLCSH